MNYASIEFLITFPLFCAGYWLVRSLRGKIALLVIGSLGFYAYGEPVGVPLLVAIIIFTYFVGLAIARSSSRGLLFGGAVLVLSSSRGLLVGGAVLVLLANLAYFKYAAFFASLLPFGPAPVSSFIPLGISFYTFEGIAYLMDIRRGVAPSESSLGRFSLYMAVFPHLLSGPIMRAGELLPQLHREILWRLPTFVSGLTLFVEGLAKKRLLADPSGEIVDLVFSRPGDANTVAAWVAALAFTVQIYGDFAGYTDMGRGAARMLGLELPLNFDAPYAARSITEFWRRWHISLSRWLRDYLYISLGGNRRGVRRTYANLFLTMLLGGLWHGAGITFVIWGGYHGALLAFERRFGSARIPAWLGLPLTLFLTVNGWVLFRARDWNTYTSLLTAMYLPTSGAMALPFRTIGLVVLAFAATVGVMVVTRWRPSWPDAVRRPAVRSGLLYGALAMAALLAAPAAARPFIYFRF